MTGARKGDWMQAASGRKWWPLDPRPGDFGIRDIARALAMLNRFGGHSRFPISIALHSVNTSRVCHPTWAREALMHDATEGVIGDMIRPLKTQPVMAGFTEVEARIWEAMAAQFDLLRYLPRAVKHADNVMLVTEASQCLDRSSDGQQWWEADHWPDFADIEIAEIGWRDAEALFLARFAELFPEYRGP